MKYITYRAPTETWYFEVNDNSSAFRQIVVKDGQETITSNRKHKRYGFYLSDQEVNVNNKVYVHITKEEFEAKWKQSLQPYLPEWNYIKRTFQIGVEVDGFIEVFYPHGVVINLLKHDAIGFVYDEESKVSVSLGWLASRQLIKAIVKGFDDNNQWVILEGEI